MALSRRLEDLGFDPTPPYQGDRVQTSLLELDFAAFSPPSPPILGGTGMIMKEKESPPELGDLGGNWRKGLMGYSFLLPAGEDALSVCQQLIPSERSPVTFKWKIGVGSLAEEIEIFHQLIQVLPKTAKLRLDANGGLTFQEACQWLRVADEAGMVEFIEQPLPPPEFERMLELSVNYATPLALDESVSLLGQLQHCYGRGWGGIFVIKAAIAGYPSRLRQFCREHDIDAVFSSVFETAIGRKAALNLACELNNPNRAVGFGVDAWFSR